MSAISAVFTNILAKTPLSSTFGMVGLPTEQDEPLLTSKGANFSEKCELRIEGMTCGSCVEVSLLLDDGYMVLINLLCRQSKACFVTRLASIRSKLLSWQSEAS